MRYGFLGILFCALSLLLIGMPARAVISGQDGDVRMGARLFMMRCLGCHSVSGMRVASLHTELGLSAPDLSPMITPEALMRLDPLLSRVGENNARRWFATPPPDLTNEVIVRGASWVRTYLLGFYADDQSTTGWNNIALPGTMMPNPFFDEQGWRGAVIREQQVATDAQGRTHHLLLTDTIDVNGHHQRVVQAFAGSVVPGQLGVQLMPLTVSPALQKQNERHVAQLLAFLCYVSDPDARHRIGLSWVIMPLLCVLFFVLYGLKRLYWRSVNKHPAETSIEKSE